MRFGRSLSVVAVAGLASALAPQVRAAAPPLVCTEKAEGGPLVAYGLTADQRLICFKLNRPSVNRTIMAPLSLAAPDTALVGIDVRPAGGAVYGLGNGGGIYLLDPAATKPELKSRLSVALEGSSFGVDFNPTVDRLRIISDSGQNLRVNVDTGAATVDGFLKNGAVRATGVGSAAYTNVDNDASTATTLYDINGPADLLVTQAPPNDGTLVSVGKMGFQGSAIGSFDIWSEIKDGKAVSNRGFATLDGGDVLFEIDLQNGATTFVGIISARLIGMAFPV